MILEATVIEFKKRRLKKSEIEKVKLLIDEGSNGSVVVESTFSLTYFPAMIYYNKPALIGHRLNISVEEQSLEEFNVRLLPWEDQDSDIKKEIYSSFFEAFSELYFSKEKNDQFRKDFEKYKRRRLKLKHLGTQSLTKYLVRKDISKKDLDRKGVFMSAFERRELKRNKEFLEKIFKLNLEK